jgi:hypothetical protein
MDDLYVMRRANGDLLIVEVQGKPRIPVWQSTDSVSQYKALNPELIFYWPVKLSREVVKRTTGKSPSNKPVDLLLLPAEARNAHFEEGRPATLDEILPESSASQSAPVRY